MAYNIDSIDIVSGELQITPAGLLRFAREVEADPEAYLPEGMGDALANPESHVNPFKNPGIVWARVREWREEIREVAVDMFKAGEVEAVTDLGERRFVGIDLAGPFYLVMQLRSGRFYVEETSSAPKGSS